MRFQESTGFVSAPAEQVFDFVDDHSRLSSHMSRSSWMMGGGRMDLVLDAERGRSVGSRIRLEGKAFGIRLFLDEVVCSPATTPDGAREGWSSMR
jgi:hypothetical protein